MGRVRASGRKIKHERRLCARQNDIVLRCALCYRLMKLWPFFDPVIDADFASWRRSEFRRRLNEG